MDIVIHKAPSKYQPLIADLAEFQANIQAMSQAAADAYLKLSSARMVFGAETPRVGENYSIMVKGSTA